MSLSNSRSLLTPRAIDYRSALSPTGHHDTGASLTQDGGNIGGHMGGLSCLVPQRQLAEEILPPISHHHRFSLHFSPLTTAVTHDLNTQAIPSTLIMYYPYPQRFFIMVHPPDTILQIQGRWDIPPRLSNNSSATKRPNIPQANTSYIHHSYTTITAR